jgi:ketosteroid isomerase-like protein
VRTEIDASSGRFLEELAKGDAAAAAAVYAEGAILLPPTGEVIRGRKAIESFWRSGIEIGVRSVELQRIEHSEADRLLYELGRYRMLVQRAGHEPKLERGAYVHLHKQEPDGSWRRAVDMFNRSPSQASEKDVGVGKGGSRR